MVESLSINDTVPYGDSIFADHPVTVEDVLKMTHASDKLYCRLSDNKVMTFGHYTIKDYDSKEILVDTSEELQ
jgi:hypothetical protein